MGGGTEETGGGRGKGDEGVRPERSGTAEEAAGGGEEKKELKRSRPESEMEVEAELEKEEEKTGKSAMMDRDMVWRMKARRICRECRKGGRKCFWPEALSRAKACHQCSSLKAKCVVVGQESSEAGPSKKRKVAVDKGKGKAKEVKEMKSKLEFRFRELVEEL